MELFRTLSDDFVSGLYPGKLARLRVDLAEQLEGVVEDFVRVGVITGNDVLKVFGDFGQKGHVCCIVQGSSPVSAIEIDGPNNIYVLLRGVKQNVQENGSLGPPLGSGPHRTSVRRTPSHWRGQ